MNRSFTFYKLHKKNLVLPEVDLFVIVYCVIKVYVVHTSVVEVTHKEV